MAAETALATLADYRGKELQYNILAPMTKGIAQISPFHQLITREISLSPNPDDKDVYEESGALAPTKRALRKLADLAGINILPSRVLSRTETECVVQAFVAAPTLDGGWRMVSAIKETQEREEAQELKSPTAKAIAGLRKHRLAKTESKAINRCIRDALSMKSTYTAEELHRPFVVPMIAFRPDYSDPGVRQVLLQQAFQARTSLFGPQRGGAALPAADTIDADIKLLTDEPSSDAGRREEPAINGTAKPVLGAESFRPEDETEADLFPFGKLICIECGQVIQGTAEWPEAKMRDYLMNRYGKILCAACRRGVKPVGKS